MQLSAGGHAIVVQVFGGSAGDRVQMCRAVIIKLYYRKYVVPDVVPDVARE